MDFIAVDGEAIDDEYRLLASSTGTHVIKDKELSTKQCFDFLFSLPSKETTLVCFGLNYDANMWLKSLPKPLLIDLWNEQWVIWKAPDKYNYRIEWAPGHWFKVHRAGYEGERGPTFTVYEVWGFFQSSFVNALKSWGFSPSDELQLMKSQRGDFKASELQRTIDYCHGECLLLVKLMNALRDACREAEIVPKRWMGAGSLAARLLESRSSVKDHFLPDDELCCPESYDAVLRAYFGGRVEMLKQGVFENVRSADIRSAYPSAITQLVSMQGGKLSYTKTFTPGSPGVWHVRWKRTRKCELMPFPVRYKGDIYYPAEGSGWYHTPEVIAGLHDPCCNIEIIEGWRLVTENTQPIYPLAWVKKVFDLREEWKHEGRAAEKVLKLSLNSMYGKFAQGIGWKPVGYYHTVKPKWQSFFWAGEITSRTRARMLEAAHASKNPMMIATDGLFANDKIPREQKGLGGWETERYKFVFIVRPGVYLAERYDGTSLVRSRGFRERDVDFYDLMEHFKQTGLYDHYTFRTRRFVGLGTALMRKDFSVWKTWEDTSRKLSYLVASKDVDEKTREIYAYSASLPLSEPYKLKSVLDTDENKVQVNEQPMKV